MFIAAKVHRLCDISNKHQPSTSIGLQSVSIGRKECPSLAMSLLQSSFVHLVVPTSAVETATFNTDFEIKTTSM